ncbi:putative leader peptide [Pseudonocardia acaciae]
MGDGGWVPGRPGVAPLHVTLLRSRRHVDLCRTATALCRPF